MLLSLPDSTFVAGSISNEEGAFSLNVKETKDVLRISSIGYATVYRPLDNRSTDLGIICLASDTQILAEVVVLPTPPFPDVTTITSLIKHLRKLSFHTDF